MPERKPRKAKEEEKNVSALNPDSDLPPDADAEERFNDFWKKNGPSIFGGIALAAVIVCGYQFYQYMGNQKLESMQDAYLASEDTAAKLTFADEFEDKRLAGVALLQAADSLYDEGQYSEAVEAYRSALDTLGGTPLHARARIGHAMALAGQGKTEEALGELESIALDVSALDALRGEAAYNLAVMRWEQGNLDALGNALELIYSLDEPGIYEFRANQLRDRVPGLNELAAADEAEQPAG